MTGGWVTFSGEFSEWLRKLEGDMEAVGDWGGAGEEDVKWSGEEVLCWREEADLVVRSYWWKEGRGDEGPIRDTRLLDLDLNLGDCGTTVSFLLLVCLSLGDSAGLVGSEAYESCVGAKDRAFRTSLAACPGGGRGASTQPTKGT